MLLAETESKTNLTNTHNSNGSESNPEYRMLTTYSDDKFSFHQMSMIREQISQSTAEDIMKVKTSNLPI